MTDSSGVILEKRGQAYWITINRPDKRNAINGDVIAGIAKGPRWPRACSIMWCRRPSSTPSWTG
jgi:hypothetical protein